MRGWAGRSVLRSALAMVRCPTCFRGVAASSRCPEDGTLAPSPPRAPLSAAVPVVPGFAISKLLGSGGFGAVWEALAADATVVALKIGHTADAAAVMRLAHEAAAPARRGPPPVSQPFSHSPLACG